MVSPPSDFESDASTNFATPATRAEIYTSRRQNGTAVVTDGLPPLRHQDQRPTHHAQSDAHEHGSGRNIFGASR